MEKGKIIVVDGADGTGKATTAKLVLQMFEERRPLGASAATHSFPTYGEFYGRQVRAYLDGDSAHELVRVPDDIRNDPICAAVPYAMDRYVAFRKVLGQVLESGDWLILDRYYTANLVYQSTKVPLDERMDTVERLLTLEHAVCMVPKPDLVVILDIPEELRQLRVKERRAKGIDGGKIGTTDIHEQNDAFMAEVAKQYRTLAKQFNWKVINVAPDSVNQLPPEAVAELVYEEILKKFEKLRT